MLAMSIYGYVEEYKELVETEKLALTKCWKIVNDKNLQLQRKIQR